MNGVFFQSDDAGHARDMTILVLVSRIKLVNGIS